jgi:hypothetical protein
MSQTHSERFERLATSRFVRLVWHAPFRPPARAVVLRGHASRHHHGPRNRMACGGNSAAGLATKKIYTHMWPGFLLSCHAVANPLVAMRTCTRVVNTYFASLTGTTTLALHECSPDHACHHACECSPTGVDAVAATDLLLSSLLPTLPICCCILPVLPMHTQAFDHPNIVKLLDVLKADNDKDIYLVFEHMDTDLHRARKLFVVARIPQPVKHAHTFQFVQTELPALASCLVPACI